jgi:hypothetical protein
MLSLSAIAFLKAGQQVILVSLDAICQLSAKFFVSN